MRVKIRAEIPLKTYECVILVQSFSCKTVSLPFYSLLILTAMSILFSDTGTTFSGETLMGFLLALVVLCLAFIIVLTVIVVRQRRQIARKNECIVRNASLYLGLIHKKDVPELSRIRPESELSQGEMVSLRQLIRKMIYGFAMTLPAATVLGQ